MNRLTDNDHNLGPFTLAFWKGRFSAELKSGSDGETANKLLFCAFGYAIRIQLPGILKAAGKYGDEERCYGFCLSDQGNGYDFLQIHYGPQTYDSSTDKTWSYFLPWKQWRCVRSSIYEPDGTLFANEPRGKRRAKGDIFEFIRIKEQCPAVHFCFADYDGEEIIATCKIEEREWHRGEGWFKWLRFFYPAKIRRSLDIAFSAEVGPEKGSWKGGTLGHGIDMEKGETPRQAFERYCAKNHERKGRNFKLKFISPCPPPKPRERAIPEQAAMDSKANGA